MPDPTLLSTTDLAVAAGAKRLLEGIDIELSAGELLAVTGPSGCGKSTLLRAIAGLDDPAGGRVRYAGQTPDEIGWPRFRRHVVLVHQRPVMLDTSVEENLRRPLRHKCVDAPFQRDRAEAMLVSLSLRPDHLQQPARTLSIGEQQRIALVRALLIEPAVLLLDEPTSALDEEARTAIEVFLHDGIEQRGLAALIVTHDRQQADRLCEHQLDLRPHMPGGSARGGDDDG